MPTFTPRCTANLATKHGCQRDIQKQELACTFLDTVNVYSSVVTAEKFEISTGFNKRGDTESLLLDKLLPQHLTNSFKVFISFSQCVFYLQTTYLWLALNCTSPAIEEDAGKHVDHTSAPSATTQSGRQPLEGTMHLARFTTCFRRKMGGIHVLDSTSYINEQRDKPTYRH